MSLFNIATKDGELMLGVSVSETEAKRYLKHYTDNVGKPYPNGKGFYPDRGYHVIPSEKGFLSAADLKALEWPIR